jgi:putative transposase
LRQRHVGPGQRIRLLAIEVESSLPAERVTRVLSRLIADHGVPKELQMENGPQLTSRTLDQWAYEHGVQLRFIDPGEPVQNAFIEHFNGRLRDECRNEHWFVSLADTPRIVETWRDDSNRVRPQSSLGNRSSEEFRETLLQLA